MPPSSTGGLIFFEGGSPGVAVGLFHFFSKNTLCLERPVHNPNYAFAGSSCSSPPAEQRRLDLSLSIPRRLLDSLRHTWSVAMPSTCLRPSLGGIRVFFSTTTKSYLKCEIVKPHPVIRLLSQQQQRFLVVMMAVEWLLPELRLPRTSLVGVIDDTHLQQMKRVNYFDSS